MRGFPTPKLTPISRIRKLCVKIQGNESHLNKAREPEKEFIPPKGGSGRGLALRGDSIGFSALFPACRQAGLVRFFWASKRNEQTNLLVLAKESIKNRQAKEKK